MSKRIHLHVGLPKTGTSTIQKYLHARETELRGIGYVYPGLNEHPALAHHNHHLMRNAMMNDVVAPSEGLDLAGCRKAIREIMRDFGQSRSVHDMILSEEGMAMAAPKWNAAFLDGLLDRFEVSVVVFVRYLDDFVESLFKETIWARAGSKPDHVFTRPLRPLSSPTILVEAGERRKSQLEHGLRVARSLKLIQKKLPSARLVVRSFDANKDRKAVLSGALSALGIPASGPFANADADGGVRNPTKPSAISMLIFELIQAGIDRETLQVIGREARRRSRLGLDFDFLEGRRFRFLSEANIIVARQAYAELRATYPELPVQPDHVEREVEHALPVADARRMLEEMRPQLGDDTYEAAIRVFM